MRGRPQINHQPTQFIHSELLAQKGIKLGRCRHCSGRPEMRSCRRDNASACNTQLAWVICTSCSMQTGRYSLDETTYRFLEMVWNRTPEKGSFDSGIEQRGLYG